MGEIAGSTTAKRRRQDETANKGKKEKDKDENQKGWFDAETKCRKAERLFQQALTRWSNMEKVIKESQGALDEFRQAPDEFQEEMQIWSDASYGCKLC